MTFATHTSEWTDGSGISPEIAKLNVETLIDSKIISGRLGWLAWVHDFGGWYCSGLDLKTGKKSKGQFKPDKPIETSDGKLAKYLTGKTYDAIALKMPDEGYWQSVIDDVTKPVVITEGAKKAGALMTCGLCSPSTLRCGYGTTGQRTYSA
jgi:putative DNA primase/helicase